MDAEKRALIVRATRGLRLKDIALFQARFEQPNADTGESAQPVFQQNKRGVAYTVGDAPHSDDPMARLLQVRVSLGTRLVQNTDADTQRPLIVIEADYLVEYEMNDELPDDALKAFAEFCAIHNAWPFWREHVFNVVGRGRLPRLEVPLFEGELL